MSEKVKMAVSSKEQGNIFDPKGPTRQFYGVHNVLFLDLGGGYTAVLFIIIS